MTSDVRAHLKARVESFDQWLREGGNGDVADLLRDLLAALIAEEPQQQEDADVERRADEAFRELVTYRDDDEDRIAEGPSQQEKLCVNDIAGSAFVSTDGQSLAGTTGGPAPSVERSQAIRAAPRSAPATAEDPPTPLLPGEQDPRD